MRYLSILLFLLFCYSCGLIGSNYSDEHSKCASFFYGDSLLISKNKDSLITIKNYLSNEEYNIVSKTEYCLLPIVKDNNVSFLRSDSLIECINLSSKNKIWEFKAKNKINNIRYFDQFLILNIENEGVTVLMLRSGLPYRIFNKNKDQSCNDMLVNDFILDNEKLFITDFRCNNISAFDLTNGDLKWGYNTSLSATRVLLCDTVLFCGITGNPLKEEGKIVLLNKENGEILFERNELFDLIVKPVKYLNYIFFVTYDKKIKKLDLVTKKVTHLIDLGDLGGICDNQLYLQGSKIYFSNCDNNIYEYDIKKSKLIFVKKSKRRILNVFEVNNVLYFDN